MELLFLVRLWHWRWEHVPHMPAQEDDLSISFHLRECLAAGYDPCTKGMHKMVLPLGRRTWRREEKNISLANKCNSLVSASSCYPTPHHQITYSLPLRMIMSQLWHQMLHMLLGLATHARWLQQQHATCGVTHCPSTWMRLRLLLIKLLSTREQHLFLSWME